MSIWDDLQVYYRAKSGYYEDHSGNARDLQEVGTTVALDVAGIQDAAIRFSGSALPTYQHLERAAEDSVLDFGAGGFTVSMWLRPSSTGGFHTMAEKFFTAAPGGDGWTCGLYPDLTPYFGHGRGYAFLFHGTTALSAGVWNHLVYRRSGNDWTIWVNGAQTDATSDATAVSNTSEVLRVGQRFNDVDTFSYVGHMDELAIWTRAISDGEIAGLYGAGVAGYAQDPTVAEVSTDAGGATVAQHGFAIGTAAWATCYGPP